MSSCDFARAGVVSINGHQEIREALEGFRLEQLSIRYSNNNQRLGKAEVRGELAIMNW